MSEQLCKTHTRNISHISTHLLRASGCVATAASPGSSESPDELSGFWASQAFQDTQLRAEAQSRPQVKRENWASRGTWMKMSFLCLLASPLAWRLQRCQFPKPSEDPQSLGVRSRRENTQSPWAAMGSQVGLQVIKMQAQWWLRWWRIRLQYRRPGFDPWARKIPWRRKWQTSPVFLAGEFKGQRRLVGYSPWGRKELDTTEWGSTQDTVPVQCPTGT